MSMQSILLYTVQKYYYNHLAVLFFGQIRILINIISFYIYFTIHINTIKINVITIIFIGLYVILLLATKIYRNKFRMTHEMRLQQENLRYFILFRYKNTNKMMNLTNMFIMKIIVTCVFFRASTPIEEVPPELPEEEPEADEGEDSREVKDKDNEPQVSEATASHRARDDDQPQVSEKAASYRMKEDSFDADGARRVQFQIGNYLY